jgi:hypothetical protein
VRWLVAQPALGLAVLAGSDDLDRAVTWAHSIELTDPAPWLRGGELLLATGLRLPADPDGQRRYVRSVAASVVAAIGFGVGLSHRSVPDALVAAAEQLGLPLLEVPLPTPFVAVVRAVTERLAELQYEGVVRASQVQPRMTRAAVRQWYRSRRRAAGAGRGARRARRAARPGRCWRDAPGDRRRGRGRIRGAGYQTGVGPDRRLGERAPGGVVSAASRSSRRYGTARP